MADLETTRTAAPRALVVVEGDSSTGIARARDVTHVFVEGLDPAPAPGTAETLALVVSELTTDALRHGGGRCTAELGATAGAVHVAVSDLDPAPRGNVPPTSTGAPTGSDGLWSAASPAR